MTLRDEEKGRRKDIARKEALGWNEERRAGDRLNRREAKNGRILPGFAYHFVNSEQCTDLVSCLSFFTLLSLEFVRGDPYGYLI